QLESKLPEQLVPAVFVKLEALPRTTSGKLDRRALPDPGRQRPELEERFESARTEVERRIAEVWQDLLGLDRVGVRDNFFEAGGDSILAVSAAARLQEILQRPIEVMDLFRHPTVAALAHHLSGAEAPTVSPEALREKSRAGQDRLAQRRVRRSQGAG
ncbi:MAG TPA: phosphopantetheine-binding protein, partial [Thermoanaerobaculia bacterium]|nr:phosphopantetheine-binding protein [Thermoanaerobaculia bacterium]